MGSIDIEELVRILPDLFKKNDKVKRAILSVVSDYYAPNEAIQEMMEKSDKRFQEMMEKSDKRFEASDKKLEDFREETQKGFEASDKKLEDFREETRKGFEASDKKLEDFREETRKGFDAVDQRFEASDKKLEDFQEETRKGFDAVDKRFDDLIADNDIAFELSCINFIAKLENCNPKDFGFRRTISDPQKIVFPDTTLLEIDLLHEDPFIIGEVTIRLKSIAKLQKFLKKLSFVEKMFDKKAKRYFCFMKFNKTAEQQGELEKIEQYAKENNIILIPGKIIQPTKKHA